MGQRRFCRWPIPWVDSSFSSETPPTGFSWQFVSLDLVLPSRATSEAVFSPCSLPLSAEEAHPLAGLHGARLPAPSPFYGPFAKTREAQGTFLSIQRLQERTGKRLGDCQKAAMHHRHLVRIWIKGRLNQMPLLSQTQDPCLSRTVLELSASWKWAEYLGGLRGPGAAGWSWHLLLGATSWMVSHSQGRWALQGSRVAMASSRFLPSCLAWFRRAGIASHASFIFFRIGPSSPSMSSRGQMLCSAERIVWSFSGRQNQARPP